MQVNTDELKEVFSSLVEAVKHVIGMLAKDDKIFKDVGTISSRLYKALEDGNAKLRHEDIVKLMCAMCESGKVNK